MPSHPSDKPSLYINPQNHSSGSLRRNCATPSLKDLATLAELSFAPKDSNALAELLENLQALVAARALVKKQDFSSPPVSPRACLCYYHVCSENTSNPCAKETLEDKGLYRSPLTRSSST